MTGLVCSAPALWTEPRVVARADWNNLVRARTDVSRGVSVSAFSPAAPMPTFSAPFRVVGSDRRDYFVKALDNQHAGMEPTLAAELVVAGVGRLIGAPVIRTVVIEIPAALAGYEPRPGTPISAGLAHASQALEHADEKGRPRLVARSQDDNSRRHAGVYALYDWCWGSDQQWLYDLDDDDRLYSHDHGLYLPSGWWHGPAALEAHVDQPHVLPDPPAGVLPSAVDEVADRLEAVTRTEIASILNQVPAAWPVADDALETLGWFLESRASDVAVRMRSLLTP